MRNKLPKSSLSTVQREQLSARLSWPGCFARRERKRLIVCLRMPLSTKRILLLLLRLPSSEPSAFKLVTLKEHRKLCWKVRRLSRRGSKFSVTPIWTWETSGLRERTIKRLLIITKKSSRHLHITILKPLWIMNHVSILSNWTHSLPTWMLIPTWQWCMFSSISLKKASITVKSLLSWNHKNQSHRSTSQIF